MNRERRYGHFKVAGRFFRDLVEIDGVIAGANLFVGMVVIETQVDYRSDTRTYYAVHPSFRALTDGELAPEYRAIFKDGETVPVWQEITFEDMSAMAYVDALGVIAANRKWTAREETTSPIRWWTRVWLTVKEVFS